MEERRVSRTDNNVDMSQNINGQTGMSQLEATRTDLVWVADPYFVPSVTEMGHRVSTFPKE